MGTKPQLYPIDLTSKSRDTVAALIKLLTPHAPYSLTILGTIINAGPRTHTIQDVDTSQVSLWSTIPLPLLRHSESTIIFDPPALFSIVVFSHSSHQFYFFCSAESSTGATTNSPTADEEAHVEHVFALLRGIARKERPSYDSVLIASRGTPPTQRADSDPPMILVGAVHGKWQHCLEKVSEFQNPTLRYPLPPGFRARDGGGQEGADKWILSQIQPSDIPFVRGASSIPRSEEYIMSRAPYSVCLRTRAGETGNDTGRPVACAFIHSDGSIGSLHVDPEYQRKGLGKLVIGLLAEALDFRKGRNDTPSAYDDLGGGAIGWNWTDTLESNKVAHRFFTSLAGEGRKWMVHWTYMLVDHAEEVQ